MLCLDKAPGTAILLYVPGDGVAPTAMSMLLLGSSNQIIQGKRTVRLFTLRPKEHGKAPL